MGRGGMGWGVRGKCRFPFFFDARYCVFPRPPFWWVPRPMLQ